MADVAKDLREVSETLKPYMATTETNETVVTNDVAQDGDSDENPPTN